MADDPYNWLDKDAAERMLRGDPVGPRDGVGARELEQLLEAAKAVGAAIPEATELPGEDAALAAFRSARHGTGARTGNRATGDRATGDRVTAVSTTRSGGLAERTRLARPFRRGFAVALTVCAIGGVAVAAGTGMLPPFEGGDADPEPASSVSAAETPGILESRQPDGGSGGTATHTPDATHGHGSTDPSGTGTPGNGHGPGGSQKPGDATPGGGPGDNAAVGGSGDDGKPRPGDADQKKLILQLCHDYQSGKRDTMDREALRRLERAAGGPDKIRSFCRKYLASNQNGGSGGDDGYSGGSSGSGGSGHGGSGGGKGGGQGGGDGDDDSDPAASTTSGASTPASAPTVTPSASPSATSSPAPTSQV
ncbi:hypothetical protein [Streptomyces piniterrae]|uniref:hypothetical protein n=1 Tax=Streptomyces piniterrae TaxID=2571125 RepID=UPI00145DDF91|nr:hypothetical protein [Streptomyces piniterrae]